MATLRLISRLREPTSEGDTLACLSIREFYGVFHSAK